MELDEMVEELSNEQLKARIKTVERHAQVAEQDFYEKEMRINVDQTTRT